MNKTGTCILTIFTPTFNREATLPRVFESLNKQKCNAFIWLIVDDGSKDNTKQLVYSFKDKSNFHIEYTYQENAGKQAAWNKALEICNTPYFLCIDSDDALTDDAVSMIMKFLPMVKANNIIGLRFNAINTCTGQVESEYFSNECVIKSWFDEVANEKYVGEKLDVFKTETLRKFKFPVNKDVKFIPESYMYSSIAKAELKFLYVPQAIRYFFDEPNPERLSLSSIKKHAEGHYIYRSHLLKVIPTRVYIKNPLFFIKTLIRFSQTAKFTKKSFNERSKSSNKVIAFLSYVVQFFPL